MKRSLRDYLVTLGLAVVVFTVAAFFLIRAAEGLMGAVVNKIGSEGEVETVTEEKTEPVTSDQQVNATPEPESKEDITATFLVLGIDESGKNADAIFLVAINATKKQATVALIPSNTVVPEADKKYKLGELYGNRSANFYKEFVAQETGITPDYYAAISMSGLANLIDFLGGIPYNVPENMYYFDSSQNLKINLRAGNQTLTGDQAVQLVAYRGYAAGNAAREETQLGFAKAFCSLFLRAENLSRFKSIFYNITYNVETDFDESDLNVTGDLIFHFNEYSQVFTKIPGAPAGDVYYAISTSRAESMFSTYK